MRLHKEGRYIIPITLIGVTVVCGLLVLFSPYSVLNISVISMSLILLVLILNFFRHPEIQIPTASDLILAPCDGKVVVIEEIDAPEGMLGRVRQVSIFMSPLNVHVNRLPIGGKVKKLEYRPGKYLVAWHPKSSSLNEQTLLIVEREGLIVGFKQIAGALARRICWYIKEGDSVEQGREFGFIRFGSRMDVLFPLDAELRVSIGDKVQGGVSTIAKV